MKDYFSKKTDAVRQLIVKLITPTLYKSSRFYYPRPMIEYMEKNLTKKSLIGVEIGVLAGINAESILRTLPIKKLYLVDPYMSYVNTFGKLFVPRKKLPEAKKRLSKFGEKTIFIFKKASQAVNDIPDGLDFVYIDGRHTYEFVKKDIELYYSKVREGGVIGGHDFTCCYFGVCKAVTEFVNKNNLKIYGEESYGEKSDWWIVK